MRHGVKSKLRAVLLGLAGLSLVACATEEVRPLPCPNIFIVSDGAKLTRFKPGPGRDIIDVLHEEEMTGFAHGCDYDIDDNGVGTLNVLVAPSILSSRGAANQTGDADFEYFVAITDSNKKVLNKKRFPVIIPYPKNFSRINWQTQTPHNLALPIKAGQNGADYEVYLGLQLSRTELEYLRKSR